MAASVPKENGLSEELGFIRKPPLAWKMLPSELA